MLKWFVRQQIGVALSEARSIMTMIKVVCKFTDGDFGRNISKREDKSISRVSDYSSESKSLPPS